MPVDESSSQDATLIDDDLVSALGFEPVTSGNGLRPDAVSGTNGATIREGDSDEHELVAESGTGEADLDDPVADEIVLDEASDDTPDDGTDVVDLGGLVDDVDVESTALEESALEESALEESALDDEVGGDQSAGAESIDVELESDPLAERSTGGTGSSFFDLDLDDGESGPDADQADLSVMEVIDLDRVDAGTDAPDPDPALTDPALTDDEEGDTAFAEDDVADDAFADDAFADTVFADEANAEIAVADHTTGQPDDASTESVSVAPAPTSAELFDVESAGDPTVAGVAAVTSPGPVRRRRRLRARKSRRVIRHIDPWSVLTFSVLFHMVVFAALLLSSVLVWNAAIASGMVENVESFIQELGDYETFTINADVMFRAAIVIAGMLTLASSVLVVLLTVVFNLISDLVGGIRVTVIEEETVRVPIDKNRSKPPAD